MNLPLRPRVPKHEEVPEDEKEREKFEKETEEQQDKDKALREHNLADSCDPLCQVIIGNSSGGLPSDMPLCLPTASLRPVLFALELALPKKLSWVS